MLRYKKYCHSDKSNKAIPYSTFHTWKKRRAAMDSSGPSRHPYWENPNPDQDLPLEIQNQYQVCDFQWNQGVNYTTPEVERNHTESFEEQANSKQDEAGCATDNLPLCNSPNIPSFSTEEGDINTEGDDIDQPSSEANCDSKLYDGARITKSQSLLMIMGFLIKHNITNVALADFLAILNLHCPVDSLPISKYLFHKAFTSTECQYNIHQYCKNCLSLVKDTEKACNFCKATLQPATAKEQNFFISVPLTSQLKDLLEHFDVLDDTYIKTIKKTNNNYYEDMFDGELYQQQVKNSKSPLSKENGLSLSIAVDGAPVFKSAPVSVWPVQVLVNEIPLQLRKKNVLLHGLWFGDSKPCPDTFFKPLIKEYSDLCQEGIQWEDRNTGAVKRTFFQLTTVICDAIAKPLLQNCKQFNGIFGCPCCLHPGISVKKNNGSMRAYPMKSGAQKEYTLREHKATIQNAVMAVATGKAEYGVLGFSSLSQIPFLDIIRGVPVDYMHCLLLGVTRQLTNMFLNSKYHQEKYYLGNKIQELDCRLKKIKPPSTIPRAPRSLSLRKFWKAHEWRAWLFFYSIPVLKDLLPEVFLMNWSLLVYSSGCLLQEKVHKSVLSTCQMMIVDFIEGVCILYGIEHCTFNVHATSHLVQSVQDWGPLWAHSAFIFEHNNKELVDLVKSSNNVPKQIVNRYIMQKSFTYKQLTFKCHNNNKVGIVMNKLRNRNQPLKNAFKFPENVTALGTPWQGNLLGADFAAVHNFSSKYQKNSSVWYYERVIVGDSVYHSKMYTRSKTRNNCVVLLRNGEIFRIIKYLTSMMKDELIALGYLYKKLPRNLCFFIQSNQMLAAERAHNNLVAVSCKEFSKKCVLIDLPHFPYVLLCPTFNSFESSWM